MTDECGADDRLAADLATAAGALLLAVRDEIGYDEPRRLKDEGDRRAHELLLARLRQARPQDAVLSEEGVEGSAEAPDSSARVGAARVWIVDPLDGTREFGEPGRSDWAVHVALWSAGRLTAGAVALPALGVTYATGALLPKFGELPTPPRVVVSRSRPPAVSHDVATALGATTMALGSAGAKAMAVVRGDADVYVHAGGQYEWDSAAPVAVARAAGLHTSRLDGSPLRYNQRDPYLPDLVVCRQELAEAVLAVTSDPAGRRQH